MRTLLASPDEMYGAICRRDAEYEGVFVFAVTTTGVFCRPGCSARTPRRENVTFHRRAEDALARGFRACRRCRPLEPRGATPEWLRPLLDALRAEPTRRFTDADLATLGLEPARVRRWFVSRHGMTFHAYARAQRLGRAHDRLRQGDDEIGTGLDHGFESASGFRDAFHRQFATTPGRARESVVVRTASVTTPVGPMLAGAVDAGLCLLEFADRTDIDRQVTTLGRRLGAVVSPGESSHLRHIADELGAYFAGELREFSVPLVVAGTEFEAAVWSALSRVPYGETRSYGDIADAIGRPAAVRAVGSANGRNRLAIVIPCHRVVGKDGRLSGYAGGQRRKQALLDLERGTAAT